MIDSIEGKVIAIAEQTIIIQPPSSGLSFSVSVPNGAIFKEDSIVKVKTYLHWNPEQGPHLFGFPTDSERQVFLLIISCSGIGPKIGLAALRNTSPTSFIAAIVQGDIKTLSKINGIGTRKAEALIVSLKNKVAELVKNGLELGSSSEQAKTISETSSALEALGYLPLEISAAIGHLSQQNLPSDTSVALYLKKALSFLSQNRAR